MTRDSPLFLETHRFVEKKEASRKYSPGGRKLPSGNLSCKAFKPVKFEFTEEDEEEYAHCLKEDLNDPTSQTFDDSEIATTPTDDKSFCIPLPTDRISRSNSAVDLSKLGQGFHSDSYLDLSNHYELSEEIVEEEELEDANEYYTADVQKKAPFELLPVEILGKFLPKNTIFSSATTHLSAPGVDCCDEPC